MTRRYGCRLIALLGAPLLAYGQKPVVYPGGVVNAASFAKAGTPSSGLATGSIVAIFGTNLAATTARAESLPLATSLAGTSVTFRGVPAPLFFVSPGQINAQVPRYGLGPIVVTTAAGSSDPAEANVNPNGLGIFTLNGTGCGRAVIFNVGPEGMSLNGPENSAEPGGWIAVFGNGVNSWSLYPAIPQDGYPSPANPLSVVRNPTLYTSVVGPRRTTLPLVDWKTDQLFEFIGLAPGLVGVDQFNGRLEPATPEGCAVPFRIAVYSSSMTQPVPLSVRRGGGQCVDPPVQSVGILHWRKTVFPTDTSRSPKEELAIEFSAAPGKEPQVDALIGGPDILPPGPECPEFQDRLLNAGILRASLPGGQSLEFRPATVDGKPVYSGTLPAGTIRPGNFVISSAGGADLGAFNTPLAIPAPIQLTTPIQPGTPVDGTKPFVITWTGGIPGSKVELRVFELEPEGRGGYVHQRMEAVERGQIVFAVQYGPYGPRLPFAPGTVQITIIFSPEDPSVPSFQAPGLTFGRHTWTYEFQFADVRFGV